MRLILGCYYYNELERARQSDSIAELLELHERVHQLKLPKGEERLMEYESEEEYSHVRYLYPDDTGRIHKDFLACLPAKSGSSNYLLSFAKLYLKECRHICGMSYM